MKDEQDLDRLLVLAKNLRDRLNAQQQQEELQLHLEPPVCPPHQWDDERCVRCGTKDWMVDGEGRPDEGKQSRIVVIDLS